MADGQRVTRTIQITYEAPAASAGEFEDMLFNEAHAEWNLLAYGVENVSCMAGPLPEPDEPLVEP